MSDPDTGFVEIQGGSSVSRHSDLQPFRLPATALFKVISRPELVIPPSHSISMSELRAIRAGQIAVQGITGPYWVGRDVASRVSRAPRLLPSGGSTMCLHRKIDERVAADSAASLGHHDTLRRRALLRVVRDVATLRVLHAHHLDPAGFARIGGPDVYDRAYASAPDAEAPEPECSVFPS